MVPKRWQTTQIGDVATFSSGGTPSKQTADYWGGGEPWISGKDLKSHYLSKSIDTLTEKGFATAKKAPQGASLILVRGMTLLKDFPVGYASREVAFNQDIKALVPKKNVDGLFLSFLLVAQKNRIRQLVSTAGHGTGRLDTSLVQGYPINLPPLPEQKKIAQILSTWDQAITATERLLENSQQRKKGLMQQLLTGKKRLPGFEGEWEKVKLASVAELSSGGTPKSSVGEYYNGDIPWVSIADMTSKGKWIDCTEKNLSKLGIDNSTARLYPANTVLYAMYASIGECSIAKVPVSSSQAILGIRPGEDLHYEFLYFYLSSLKEEIKLQGQQGTQSNLNAGMVKGFKIPLPSLQEQLGISEVLSSADEEIEALEKSVIALRREKKALMQQLLTGKRRVQVDTETA